MEIELLDVKWNEFEETFVTIKFLERFYKLLKIIIFKVRLCFIILGMGGNMIELELKKKIIWLVNQSSFLIIILWKQWQIL